MQCVRTSEIKVGFVHRYRLDHWCERLHLLPDLLAGEPILFTIRFYDDCIRAGFQRLKHRHCRAYAIQSRDVAACRHDTPLATANYDRLVFQAGIVPLFDRSEEGVTIEVGDA